MRSRANAPTPTVKWTILNGAGYQVQVPRRCNGRFVLWVVHRYRGDGTALTVAPPPLRRFSSTTATPGLHQATAAMSTMCAPASRTPMP